MRLSHLYLMTVLVLYHITKSAQRTPTTEHCSTEELDVVFLYLVPRNKIDLNFHEILSKSFVGDLQNFPSNKITRRVMVAGVYDKFSIQNHNVNVSSWQFGPSLESSTYGFDDVTKQRYYSTEAVIKLKINFIQRLFDEMGGARKNVTKMAVVFLDGVGLSFQETRSIPNIVAQQITDMKIFVVVFDDEFTKQTAVMGSTMYLHDKKINTNKHLLTLAICNQCMEGWWSLEHSDGADYLSCYKVLESDVYKTWHDSWSDCYNRDSALLAGIETHEELVFLQTQMISYFKQRGIHSKDSNESLQSSYEVRMGLRSDPLGVAKRFIWSFSGVIYDRSVLVNHWFSGKSSGGYKDGCLVWQFVWSGREHDVTNFSRNENRFVDGWMDVDCKTKIRYSLCEIILPRRVEDAAMLNIKPATNESLGKTLTKGDLVKFHDNVVSLSTNIGSIDFFKHLNENELFPLFDCGVDTVGSRYISFLFVCDNTNHCNNKRDEAWCHHNQNEIKENCSQYECCDHYCLSWQFISDYRDDCSDCLGEKIDNLLFNEYLKPANNRKVNETCAFICNVNECVQFSQLNDGHVDCTGTEGPLDETLGKLEAVDTCTNTLGHLIWSPRCVYVKDMYGAVFGCRNMSHLMNCTDFVCPEGYIKCPNTYCIPQHYVLDTKADCPKGEDEQIYNIGQCIGNFACWQSQMCLHPDLVCDKHPDCPHGDDELDCYPPCPESVRCVSGTVSLLDYNTTKVFSYSMNERTRYLNLSGVNVPIILKYDSDKLYSFKLDNKTYNEAPLGPVTQYLNIPSLKYVSGISMILFNLVVLVLSNCSLRQFADFLITFMTAPNLQKIDVSYNLIVRIDAGVNSFTTLENVRHLNLSYNAHFVDLNDLSLKLLDTLDLSHTSLPYLVSSFFTNFPNIKHLYLSYTPIENSRSFYFVFSSINLQTLDLRGIEIGNLFEDFFNGLTISEHLYTDSFTLCCPQIRGLNIPYHTCHAPDIVISSCFNLIGVKVQSVLIWVEAVLAVLANMVAIVYHLFLDSSVIMKDYKLFVINLCMSDFIMGVYLFIIAGADFYYSDIYVLYDKTWRVSAVCGLAGFLATVSSVTSTFFIFLAVIITFFKIRFPFNEMKLTKVAKFIAVFSSWIIGLLLALTPTVFKYGVYSSNAMCLGLPLTAQRHKGWEFSFCVFIVLNSLLSLILAVGQRITSRVMSQKIKTWTDTNTCPWPVEDILMVNQLSLLALSNFLCWFPVGFMGFLSLVGREISNDVFSWTMVIVLPVTSAANPILYTIPVLMDMWDRYKHGDKRRAIK